MNHGTCIHFNGLSFGHGGKPHCCGAGVDYRKEFRGHEPGIALRMPCTEFHERPVHGRGTSIKSGEASVLTPVDRKGQTVIPCALRVEPTIEQVDAWRKERDAHMAKVFIAFEVAAKWRTKGKPPADRSEVIDCPACTGKLHLYQSAFNGHVHGKCTTPGCVSWME